MQLFDLGAVVATPGALLRIPPSEVIAALARHACGDWGEVDSEDWAANNRSLEDGTRLLSAYTSPDGTRFWIITEWDRSVTTILLPSEY